LSTLEQFCAARIVQSESFSQALNCLLIRRTPHAALEVGDAARAQSGLLRQRLLRQASANSVAPQ
jgi:hypothetical protein